MLKKQLYSAPTAELFVVRFERGLCQSDPSKTFRQGGGGYYDDAEGDTYNNGEY